MHPKRQPSAQEVLQVILERMPGSIRALGRDSGVPHTTLCQARDGVINLSPGHTARVIATLREWGNTCLDLAEMLERAKPKR